MIKKFIFLCTSVLLVSSTNAQKIDDFALTMNFEPSFAKKSTVTFCAVKSGVYRGELIVYKDAERTKIECRESVDIKGNGIASIEEFLKTYHFKIKGSVDTISSERVFFRGDSVTSHKISIGNDGITVNGSLLQNGVTKRFAFWSPKKESENGQLIERIFILFNASFKKKKSLNHLKTLQTYF